MAVNIHITIIELNALHTKRQNLFQELDAVIHLLMEAKHWGLRKSVDRKSGSAGMPRPISYAVFCLKKKKPKAQAPPSDSAFPDLRHTSRHRSTGNQRGLWAENR